MHPGRSQGPLPPVLHTKQSSASQGPAQGLVQRMDDKGRPDCSITLYLQPLVVAPLSSTSFHLFASSPFEDQGSKENCGVASSFEPVCFLSPFYFSPLFLLIVSSCQTVQFRLYSVIHHWKAVHLTDQKMRWEVNFRPPIKRQNFRDVFRMNRNH